MRIYWIVCVILVLLFSDGLTSCKETESENSSLVGLWVSTKVDTLTQYIKPVKPNAFVSYDMKNCTLQINADGSLKMIQPDTTISGSWNPVKLDTIQLAITKDYSYRLAVDFADKNNLVISKRMGWISMSVVSGGSTYIKENWEVTVSTHFIRQ